MTNSKRGELIGIIGVYVDDFLIAGDNNKEWVSIKNKMINLYSWGKWEKTEFSLCGVQYKQHPTLNRSETTRQMRGKLADWRSVLMNTPAEGTLAWFYNRVLPVFEPSFLRAADGAYAGVRRWRPFEPAVAHAATKRPSA